MISEFKKNNRRPIPLLILFCCSILEFSCHEAGKDPVTHPASGRPHGSEHVSLPREASDLILLVENESLPKKTRADAARKLGKLRAIKYIDRLIKLLPGENDVLTYDIIIALGDMQDSKALPALEKLKAQDENGVIDLHGKTRAVLWNTIEKLKTAGMQ